MTDQNEKIILPPLSDLPRFTLAGLREILIPEGGPGTTIAKYTFRKRGRKVEKIARLDDLTEQEKAAALAFILDYGGGVRIKRKDPPPSMETLPELEPLPDDLLKDVDETDSPQGNTETQTPTGQEGTPNL